MIERQANPPPAQPAPNRYSLHIVTGNLRDAEHIGSLLISNHDEHDGRCMGLPVEESLFLGGDY